MSLSRREEKCRKGKVEGGRQCGWELPQKVGFMVPGEAGQEKRRNPTQWVSDRQTDFNKLGKLPRSRGLRESS